MSYSGPPNPEQIKAIRGRLRMAWAPFFTRFGRLTTVQEKTIPRVLDGSNVMLVAGTASGKTEAIAAPLAELHRTRKWGGLSVLYIVPTRALANDVLLRIRGPLAEMRIAVGLKHGDRPRLPATPPDWMVTTPESLDSLLGRQPQLFNQLRALILDEIHLFDGTYRGDQLRILLRRLSGALSIPPLSYLLSATLSRPGEVASRYIQEPFELVEVPGWREIQHWIVRQVTEVGPLAREFGWRKILCFCNTRQAVERVASELRPVLTPYPVFVHHGSLGRKVREEAELGMRENRVAACVATSTLELGIDIGDIDAVLIADLPWSVASFLQRIGRGNRRDAVARVVLVADPTEERFALQMLLRARQGDLDVAVYRPDLSVVVQQVLSLLFQHTRGLTSDRLADFVRPLCDAQILEQLLLHVQGLEWIDHRTGMWFATSRLMNAGERGTIHSNIPDGSAIKVLDASSGQQVGSVSGVVDNVFVLGGAGWEVVSIEGTTIRVKQVHGDAEPPQFRRASDVGAFTWMLPPGLRRSRTTALRSPPD